MIELNPDLIFSIIYSSIFIMIGIIGIYAYFISRNSLCVNIISPYGENYKLIKTFRLHPSTEKFDYKDRTYLIDLKRVAYVKGSKAYIFYELDKTEPIIWSTSKTKDSKTFNLVAGKISVIREILKGLGGRNPSDVWIYLGLGIAVGFIIASIVYPYIFHSTIEPTQAVSTASTHSTITIKP